MYTPVTLRFLSAAVKWVVVMSLSCWILSLSLSAISCKIGRDSDQLSLLQAFNNLTDRIASRGSHPNMAKVRCVSHYTSILKEHRMRSHMVVLKNCHSSGWVMPRAVSRMLDSLGSLTFISMRWMLFLLDWMSWMCRIHGWHARYGTGASRGSLL